MERFQESDDENDLSSDPKKSCWRCCCPSKETRKEMKRRDSVTIAQESLVNVPIRQTGSAREMKGDYLPLTFVPNFIIEHIFKDSFKKVPYVISSEAVLCVADVSGFTSLCESYCEEGVSGIDELASVLNGFMSTLTAMLIEGGADILNFAGDAFLVQWTSKDGNFQETVKAAFECAVNLQTHPCLLSKNLDGVLKIKVGLAVGEIVTWILGSPDFLLFVVAGQTVPVVQKAEGLCDSGEIVVSKEVYDLLQETDAHLSNISEIEDGFIKISSYETNTNTQEPDPNRLELFARCEPEHVSEAKLFLMPSLRELKSKTELQYLSELTMVTILFIAMQHVNVAEPTILDRIFDIIFESCKKFEGVMNKMLLFDKGCTFLVAFGLPGMKHTDDAVRGITCADKIVQDLKKESIQVSIGVASGTCYCGIVGHTQRQEYTLIGNRVNMAARIMVVYCDEGVCLNADAFHLSRDALGRQNFVEMPERFMKGIDRPGPIYAFRKQKQEKKKISFTHDFDFIESSQVMKEEREKGKILNCVNLMCSEKEREAVKLKSLLPVLVIKGKQNTGKVYLMFVVVDFAVDMGYTVYLTCTVPSCTDEAFFVASRLIRRMLDITMVESCAEREQKLLSALPDDCHRNMFLFNHLFKTTFPVLSEDVDTNTRNAEFMKLTKIIMRKFFQDNYILIAIYNADYMDDQSWFLLHQLAKEEKVLIALTLMHDYKEDNASAIVLLLKAYLHIDTAKCQEDLFAPVLCWVLGVKAVQTSFCQFLSDATENKVELLHEISLTSVIHDCIQVLPFDDIEEERRQKEFYVHNFVALEEKQPLACEWKPGVDLGSIALPMNINDSVKDSLNKLNLQGRLLVKRAAVLGPDFNQQALEAISQGTKEKDVVQSINNLLSNNIFTSACASECMIPEFSPKSLSPVLTKHNACFCFSYYLRLFDKEPHSLEWPISPYHRLRFRTPQFKSLILGQMTQEQLYSMRMEVADDLELYGPECTSCKRRRRSAIDAEGTDWLNDSSFSSDCKCLEIRSKIYSEVSDLYKSVGMKFLPIYFKKKSAQAANVMNYPIQALNLLDLTEAIFLQYDLVTPDEKLREESIFDPLVLDASLKKTRAESLMVLGNTYQATAYSFKALEMLGLSTLCLFGAFDAAEFKDLLYKLPLLHAEYVVKIVGLLVKLFVAVQDYTLAKELLSIEFVALSSFPVDFLLVLDHMTLLHRCNYWLNQHKDLHLLENKIVSLCQHKLRDLDALLDLTEVHEIGNAYLSIIEINMLRGKMERAEKVSSEADKVFNSVCDQSIIFKLKILRFQILYHSQMYEQCFASLQELHSEAVKDSDFLLHYWVSFMHLILTSPENVPELQAHVETCNKFASAWKPSVLVKKDILFYVTVSLALWWLNSETKESDVNFENVYSLAFHFYQEVDKSKNDYWTITSILYLLRIQLQCLKSQKLDVFEDMCKVKDKLNSLKKKIKLNFSIYSKLHQKLINEASSAVSK